jgi:hypothetical protein
MKSMIVGSRKYGLGAALAAALLALLVVRTRSGLPLPEFDRQDRPDGAPRYFVQLEASDGDALKGDPGRDYDYHTGEPVLATVFLKPATASSITQFDVHGALKETSRQVIQRRDADGKPVIQLDLRLHCLELEPTWRCDIDVGYEHNGRKKVLSVPLEVRTSATYHGELHSGHPDYAPLVKYSALPAVLTSLALVTAGLVMLFVGVHLLIGKRVPGLMQEPTAQEVLWQAMDGQAREHIAHLQAADRSPQRCEALASLLRRRFSLATCNLVALSAPAVRMREAELLTGGALAPALAICDKAVSSDREPTDGEVQQLAQAVEQMIGAAARAAKRPFSWLALLVALLLLPFVAIGWPAWCLFRLLLRRRRMAPQAVTHNDSSSASATNRGVKQGFSFPQTSGKNRRHQ